MGFSLIVRCDLKGRKKEAVCKLGQGATRFLMYISRDSVRASANTNYCGREAVWTE